MYRRPSHGPSVIPADCLPLEPLSLDPHVCIPIFASAPPLIAQIGSKIPMSTAVSKSSASAIARARHHLQGITGYSIRSDTLVRHIIEHGRDYYQTRRLALVGDMALRAAIIGSWYLTGEAVSMCFSIRCLISTSLSSLRGNCLRASGQAMLHRETPPRTATDAAAGYGENQMRDMTNNRRLASIGTATAIPSILVSSVDSDEPPYPDTNALKEALRNPEQRSKASRRRRSSDSGPNLKSRVVAPQVGEIRLATTMEAIFGAVYEDSGRNVGTVDQAMTTMGLYRPAPFAEGGTKLKKAMTRQKMLDREWEGVLKRLREERPMISAGASEERVDAPASLSETEDAAKKEG